MVEFLKLNGWTFKRGARGAEPFQKTCFRMKPAFYHFYATLVDAKHWAFPLLTFGL